MSTALSEREQFLLFQEGNKDAYAFFSLRHHAGVYDYIHAMAADAGLAEDLSREVFKRLWELRGTIYSCEHLGACSYVIARHLFMGELRRCKVLADAAGQPDDAGGRAVILNSELEVVCHRVLTELMAALQALSAKRKLVLRLLFVKQLDVSTVAVMLELSPQTVRNHKAQAIAFLRKRMLDRDLLMPLSLSSLLRYAEDE